MEAEILTDEALAQARFSVLTAQAALHAAMTGLLISKSTAGVHVAKVAVSTALLALDEIAPTKSASGQEPDQRRCIHCGSQKILESRTAGGMNLVCGDCGEDPEKAST